MFLNDNIKKENIKKSVNNLKKKLNRSLKRFQYFSNKNSNKKISYKNNRIFKNQNKTLRKQLSKVYIVKKNTDCRNLEKRSQRIIKKKHLQYKANNKLSHKVTQHGQGIFGDIVYEVSTIYIDVLEEFTNIFLLESSASSIISLAFSILSLCSRSNLASKVFASSSSL